MSHPEYRLPAEWERQSALLLAWPHEHSHWTSRLEEIRVEYSALIEAVLARQTVVLLTQPDDRSAERMLGQRPRLKCLQVPFNDTWCRDYAPITLVASGHRLAMDFRFNGWGGKYPAELDNQVNQHLARDQLFAHLGFRQSLFELEGGAIDSDGHGRLLVNWHCLQTRHPHLSRAEIRYQLCEELNVDEVIGIDLAAMPGDDTDGHIDTLVRFARPDTLVFQTQASADRNARLLGQLETLRQANGQAYQLIALPPVADFDPELPANYANFLLINDACLVPTYGVESDDQAQRILARVFPERDIVTLAAACMISQFGGPHCASMQIPAALA